MKRNTKVFRRVLSIVLCLCLILPYIPRLAKAAEPEAEFTRTADPSTMNGWVSYFYDGLDHFDTANAGGIWTDKSVLVNNDEFEAMGITGINDPSDRGFLSALSVMGSNMVITGETAVATDTVIVLDASNSMSQSAVEAMVAATNTSIKTLMDANPNNRVAVVFYETTSTVFFPLDHYTTGSDGVYLISRNEGSIIRQDPDVRDSSEEDPDINDYEVGGGTYIARGLYESLTIFNGATLDQTNTPRRPVVMLMTDGVPTYADSDFTQPARNGRNADLRNGSSTDAAHVFATELTASYVKEMATAKYGTGYECLFYTLGMGLNPEEDYSQCVMDPAEYNTGALTGLWENYENAAAGGRFVIKDNRNSADVTVTKLATPTLSADYVDKYFAAATAENLADAFQKVMTDIALQTSYHPTLVSGGDAQHSGYVSFVDKLGRYMEVVKLNGLIIDNTLYTGSHMAHAFVSGELGSVANPTELGDNLVWSLRQRLGIDADTARSLINSAYQEDQLYYNSDTDFSNYIGWYSDENNTFLGFCGENTTAPDGAVYTNKSYLFLCELDASTNVRDMEMMYSTVRVRQTIATGEQEVNFAIPASLVPTTTYTVDLDVNGNIKTLTATPATPIRLVYETALDSRINRWTAGEIVDDAYTSYVSPGGKSDTVNADGSINFFESKYDFDGETGYGQYNTYSYFRPSYENDRFYFQYDKTLYTKSGESYVPYTGAKPTAEDGNTYYYGTTVYYRNGTSQTVQTDYNLLHSPLLAAVKQNSETGAWYMPYGYVREDYVGVSYAKSENTTGTLSSYAIPYHDFASGAGNANFNAANHYLVVGTTLGNNGKITLNAENGVKITKLLETGTTVDPDKTFTFTVQTTNTGLTNAPVYKLDASGNPVDAADLVFSGGMATVELKPGEVLYIGGMANGDQVTVSEAEDIRYALKTVTVDGAVQTVTTPSVSLDVVDMHNIDFTNGLRQTGAVNVEKQIVHPYGAGYTLPDISFPITVKLTFNGKALANYSLADGITTAADGTVTFNLAHGGSKLISGIPVGTQVQVTEAASAGFTPTYGEESGTANDGIVTVEAVTTNVAITNTYQPTPADGSGIAVNGTKQYDTASIRTWAAGDSYTFTLQKLVGDIWTDMATQTVTPGTADLGTNNVIGFAFADAFKNESYTQPDTYYYRVLEQAGTIPGVDYDNRTHAFAVEVADSEMDGTLEITQVRATVNSTETVAVSGNTVTATFVNGYTAGSANAIVNIDKLVENPTGSPNATLEGFTYQIAQVSCFEQVVDWTAAATIPGATSPTGVLKHEITFTTPGTYLYKVKETAPTQAQTAAGWTFDGSEKWIQVEVINDTATAALYTKVSEQIPGATTTPGEDNRTSAVTLTFTNTYKPDGDDIIIVDTAPGVARTDFVRKNTLGRPMEAGEFTFVIWDNDNNVLYTTGTNEAAEAGAYAEVNFGENLSFDTVGEFHFSVYEQDTAKPGITKDQSIYDFAVVVTDNGQGTLEAVLTVLNGIDGNNMAAFTNNYQADSVDFAISGTKVLTGKDLTANAFSFHIQACDESGTALPGAEIATVYNNEDGTVTFPTVTYTQTGTYRYLIWENIPGSTLGIDYDQTKFMVTVKVTDNYETGKLEASASYLKQVSGGTGWHDDTAVVFNNSYSAAPAQVTFSGNKIMDGKDLTAGNYEFQLYLSDENWSQGNLLQTVANGTPVDGIAPFAFNARTFITTGTYRYLVREVIPTAGEAGVTYDESVYRITVEVTDNGRGNLEAAVSVRTAGGVPTDDLNFTNVYAPTEGTSVTFNGSKDLTKGEGTDVNFTDFTFTFQFYETDNTFLTTAGTVETADAAADGSFSFQADFTASDLGKTFYYIIKEKDNGTGGITYSTAEYHITVQVVDEVKDGKVETVVTVTDKEGAPVAESEIGFINDYSLLSGTTFNVTGNKFLSGRDILDGEFKFDLYEADTQGNPTSADPVKYGYNVGETFAINGVELKKAGTHYFLLKEDSAASVAKPGVSYDPAKYLVTVVVTDNKDGTLTAAQPTYQKLGEGAVTAPSFSNSYRADSTPHYIISGTKNLTGRDLMDGEFTFLLTPTDEEFRPQPGVPALTAVNDLQGNFAFDSISYSSAGEYFYTVTEKLGTLERMTYDPTVYYVVVSVVDNTVTGKLEATFQCMKAIDATKTDEAIVFNNTFTPVPDDITVDINVNKVVNNKGTEKLSPAGFRFALSQAEKDDVFITSDANGAGKFTLTFTEADIGQTYSYKISEVNTGKANVTYSDKVYSLNITVTLGADNKLVATVEVDGTPVDTAAVEFINEYDYTPPTTPGTGDFFNIYLWLTLILISFGGLVGTVAYNKKKEESAE